MSDAIVSSPVPPPGPPVGPRRLGKKAVRHDPRTLKLANYLPVRLPPAPAERAWSNGRTQFGMMLNSQLGDCTIAGVAHAVQVWTDNTTGMVTEADRTVQQYYQRWAGYVPGHAETDQGAVEL